MDNATTQRRKGAQMAHDLERIKLNARAIRESGFDALICGLPSNVLLLSAGYWPIVGTSFAVANGEGKVALVVPEDESELARKTGAAEVFTYKPASLDKLQTVVDAISEPLAKAASAIGVSGGRIGCDIGETHQPASYISMHLFGSSLAEAIGSALPGSNIEDAKRLLAKLRSVCTSQEVDRVRQACKAAQEAFEAAGGALRSGQSEIAVASQARLPLYRDPRARDQQHLAIMSGPRSASAHGAYAISSDRVTQAGELVMVHCNCNIAGYWTDITRTFCLGKPTEQQQRMYDAISAAREAALQAIHPGARAADVDKAARQVLSARGFGDQFKHATGHGVGFAAIDHNAQPRLHPKSPDLLEVGMVFNVEPAMYMENTQGMRHCDMVTVTDSGAEVLTPFLSDPREMILQL